MRDADYLPLLKDIKMSKHIPTLRSIGEMLNGKPPYCVCGTFMNNSKIHILTEDTYYDSQRNVGTTVLQKE